MQTTLISMNRIQTLWCIHYLFGLMHIWLVFQDKSSDVRKAAESCINEILRVSGQEAVSMIDSAGSSVIWFVHEHFFTCIVQVEKIARDIHGPALNLVLERLKPYGAFQGKLVGNLSLGICSYWFHSFKLFISRII